MFEKRRLPQREEVFIVSLLYHGFRISRKRTNLKLRRGYVIPATRREDSGGVDFWVKMPDDRRIFPVQITQRGNRLYRKYHEPSAASLRDFIEKSDKRIEAKRLMCRTYGIAFVLVRDFDGLFPSKAIAWGDMKALRHAIANLKRWL